MSEITRATKKDNSRRRYPHEHGPRPDRNARKRLEAAERNAAYAALPVAEKIKRNPSKLARIRAAEQKKGSQCQSISKSRRP